MEGSWERVRRVLAGEKPDRAPLFDLLMNDAVLSYFNGGAPIAIDDNRTGARAVTAALASRDSILPERRASLARTRRELCSWLRERGVKYIEPHANFIMIDCGREAREFSSRMPRMGVAPGRPFPPLDNFLRVSIGTDAEMARFRDVFWKVYQG